MLIHINPVVVSLGPLAVRWFGLLALAGLGLAIGLSLRDLRRQRLSRKLALDALAWGLPAGVLAARLTHVLSYWDYYFTDASALWQVPSLDGLSLWGGLLGGGLVAAARLRRDRQRRRRILDAIVPNVALGVALGRVGEFLDGHGQGLPSTLPWATQYASPLAATPDFGVPRQPAQLYDALAALALFGILQAVPIRTAAGLRVGAFLMLYGAARLGLGLVRLDPAFLFGLQLEQLLAIGAIGFGAAYTMRGLAAGRRQVVGGTVDPDGRARRTLAKEDSLAA